MLNACKNNTEGFRELLDHAHITCDQLANAKSSEIHSRVKGKDAGWLSWNRTARFGLQNGETMMTVGTQKIYVRPLAAFDIKNTTGNGSYYKAFVGKNSQGKEFAIMTACANILMKERPKSDPDIKVCELATKKMITIRKSKFNAKKHSESEKDCKTVPVVKKISVCILATKKMDSIEESKFNSKLHSKDPKDCVNEIRVCVLKTQTMTSIKETEFNAKLHSKNPDDCKPKAIPAASCSSLVVKKISRTEVELQASAQAVNGATIKSYTYIATDSSGKEVLRETVSSAQDTHSLKHTFQNEGTYSIQVIVLTSVGEQKSDACKGSFTVTPIERCPLNPELPINDPNCQPCPANPDLWVKDENCAAKVIRSKAAVNLTSNSDAQKTVAKADDRIKFTLTAKNEGYADAAFTFEDQLEDVLEYASLLDQGGGEFNKDTKTLSWKEVTLKPGEEMKRIYTVQLANSIPAAARGVSDPTSYDCRMINTFGNTTKIDVDCPAPKIVEQTVKQLPTTGPTENLLFAGIALAIVTYFYARSRQLKTEVRLIRRDLNTGSI
jgi:hypothetical protein